MFDFMIHGTDFSYIAHLAIISMSLLLGSFLRSKIRFLQRYLIPAPMIGGFFLLIFYNFFAEKIGLNNVFLGDLVYHLLNISFIAMQLRIPDNKEKVKGGNVLWQNVTAIVAEYGMQCFFGLLVTFLMIKTFFPSLCSSFGITLCLGFELGPGQAYSIASVWDHMGIFPGAGSVGLTMAAIGFVVGSIGGVILINRAAHKGWISQEYVEKLRNRGVRKGFVQKGEERKIGSYQTTDGESIDGFSFHLALIFFTYFLSSLFLYGLEWVLVKLAGNTGASLAESLWGINFIFSAFAAVLVRKIICALHIEHIIDNHTCNRIDGLTVDLTVASCLGAIQLASLSGYVVPIIILVLVGIFITCVITPWFCSRLFSDHQFFRLLMIFGTANGTLPTALSLIRVVDPDFETPVASDYVYSTGIMFFLAIPIILCVNLPANGHFWLFVGLTGLYTLGALIAYIALAKKKAFKKTGTFFYMGE